MTRTTLIAIALALLSLGPACAQDASAQDTRATPEAATGLSAARQATARHHMIVAANPLAAQAGEDILEAGGSAVDAAIATQMVLNLVEPQSSGLGGGAFIVHWDASKQKITTFDGRESAPAKALPDRFLSPDGTPLRFYTAVKSARSVGVPGVLAALELAHKKYGKLPWKRLFAPAIKIAREGFAVSPRLHALLSQVDPATFAAPARAHFYDADGHARPVGYNLKNPDFANTLEAIAQGGAKAFYNGAIAEKIVDAVEAGPLARNPLTAKDLAAYTARERAAVCVPYHAMKVCGMGPPSSGGLTIGQTLLLLDPLDLGKMPLNAQGLHLIAEAEKLSFADRNRYMADSDYVDVPSGLLDPDYLDSRRKLIDPDRAMAYAEPGDPPMAKTQHFGRDATRESHGTSHVSIVDDAGNALAMTTTIETAFGSGLWAAGFLLNNELTDFDFSPRDADGTPVANAVAGGKRPRSSMSPTIVLDARNNVRMVLGSPGGSRIIAYVLKGLIAHLDWGLGPRDAAALANFGSRNGPFEYEPGKGIEPALDALQAMGHRLHAATMTSGMHIISGDGTTLLGGADPRREGVALGQ